MPTKTEYREYLSSEHWRERRKEFLDAFPNCNQCDLPRWLAIIAYDQDLHVHHKSYARVGEEIDDDLEPLCRRCHEIKTFGNSSLHKVRKTRCSVCNIDETYDLIDRTCVYCKLVVGPIDLIPPILNREYGKPLWSHLTSNIFFAVWPDQLNEFIEQLAHLEKFHQERRINNA